MELHHTKASFSAIFFSACSGASKLLSKRSHSLGADSKALGLQHHQTYVNGLNAAIESYQKALSSDDVKGQIQLQSALKFNGGGESFRCLRLLLLVCSCKTGSSSIPTLNFWKNRVSITLGDVNI